MNSNLATILRGAVCAATLSTLWVATPAEAQIRVQISPPSWYIGTTRPVYYEGRAAYWYGDRWYYRDGREWRYYHTEPSDLRRHRRHGRAHYKRGHWRGSHRG